MKTLSTIAGKSPQVTIYCTNANRLDQIYKGAGCVNIIIELTHYVHTPNVCGY